MRIRFSTPSTLFPNLTIEQYYTTGFAISFVFSLVLTRFVGSHARKFGLLDPVDDRKIHTEPIPRLGGVALFVACAAGVGGVFLVTGGSSFAFHRHLVPLLAGSAAMFALGLYDDIRPMRARIKLATQIGIAVLATVGGLQINDIHLPLLGSFHLAPWFGFLLTVSWLVGVSNAFNLIDGLDGLASGVAVFALGAFLIVAHLFGHVGAAVMAAAVGGATVGFLFFNLPPASIFLGDSGSLFVGFSLASLGVIASEGPANGEVSLIIPLVVLGLPVLDTGLTIVRRFLRLQPIFAPDRGHIHHRLLARGHSPRNVMLLLYIACAFFSVTGAFFAFPAKSVALLIVMISILCVIALAFLVQRLGFVEFQELGRFARSGFSTRVSIRRNVRFREVSERLADFEHVGEIFRAMENAFTDENIPRAEVRLQRWFLNRRPAVVTSDGRGDDEFPVWTTNCGKTLDHNSDDAEGWWEIVLPLVSPDNRRMGSLVIWEEGQAYAASLSHLHVISDHLRTALQTKLQLLDWPEAEVLAKHLLPVPDVRGITAGIDVSAKRPATGMRNSLGARN